MSSALVQIFHAIPSSPFSALRNCIIYYDQVGCWKKPFVGRAGMKASFAGRWGERGRKPRIFSEVLSFDRNLVIIVPDVRPAKSALVFGGDLREMYFVVMG
jgi:hypothetical protein